MRIFAFLFCFLPVLALAQLDEFGDGVEELAQFKNAVYNPYIHSVNVTQMPGGGPDPVLYLNSRTRLVLTFDDLSMELNDMNYQIVHCDPDWKPTDLDYYRYAEGIEEGFINDYEYSRSLYQRYITYRLQFPNDQMRILISGNYLLKVYRNNNPNDLILTRRFQVAEPLVGISTDVHRAFDPEFRYSKQEVDFTINHEKFNIVNPRQALRVVVLQNNRWDNAITNLKPNFMNGNSLTYDYEDVNTFWGGNEQRFFDMSNFDIRSENVEGHIKRPDTVHVFLEKVKPRFQHTIIDRTTNFYGARKFGLSNPNDISINPDYAMVYFYLVTNEDLDGEYYVFGELSNYEHSARYRMQYNAEKRRYQLRLYLKQGIYNWHFHYMGERSDEGDLGPAEGNFSETLNRYSILVYYKGVTDDYYRLIGYQTVEYPTLNSNER